MLSRRKFSAFLPRQSSMRALDRDVRLHRGDFQLDNGRK